MRPSVKCGTTLSIRYYLIGWDRWSNKSLSYSRSLSILAASLFALFLANSASWIAYLANYSAYYCFAAFSASSFSIIWVTSSTSSSDSARSGFGSSSLFSSVGGCANCSAFAASLSFALYTFYAAFSKSAKNFLSPSEIILIQHGFPFCSIISFILRSYSFSLVMASMTRTFWYPIDLVKKSLIEEPLSSTFLNLYSLRRLIIPASLRCPSCAEGGNSFARAIREASSASMAIAY